MFQQIRLDVTGKPYCQDADGDGDAYTNMNLFGMCCFPSEYGVTGRRTFILSEEGQVYGKDIGGGPVDQWPADDPTAAGWTAEGT